MDFAVKHAVVRHEAVNEIEHLVDVLVQQAGRALLHEYRPAYRRIAAELLPAHRRRAQAFVLNEIGEREIGGDESEKPVVLADGLQRGDALLGDVLAHVHGREHHALERQVIFQIGPLRQIPSAPGRIDAARLHHGRNLDAVDIPGVEQVAMGNGPYCFVQETVECIGVRPDLDAAFAELRHGFTDDFGQCGLFGQDGLLDG